MQLVAFLTEAVSMSEPVVVVVSKLGVSVKDLIRGLGVVAAPAVTTGTKAIANTAIRTAECLMVLMVQLISLCRRGTFEDGGHRPSLRPVGSPRLMALLNEQNSECYGWRNTMTSVP